MASTVFSNDELVRVGDIDGSTFKLIDTTSGASLTLLDKDIFLLQPWLANRDHEDQYRLQAVKTSESVGEGNRAERRFSLVNVRLHSPPAACSQQHVFENIPQHLAQCKAERDPAELTVIVSTKSGLCEADTFYGGVVRPLLASWDYHDHDYNVLQTTSEDSIKDYAAGTLSAKANAGVRQLILLLSGDGGIVDIINGLFSCHPNPRFVKPVVGLLVLGTGNALASSSGLNSDATHGLRSFWRGGPRRIPTFIARFSPGARLLVDQGRKQERLPVDEHGYGSLHGAVVTSWGLHASLVADSDTAAYRKHGRLRFQMAANELLHPSNGSPSHVYHGKITASTTDKNGVERAVVWERTEHMYVLATQVAQLEAGLTISPRSRPLDGRLRVVHFGVLPSARVMEILGKAFDGGKHIGEPEVGYESVDTLRIEVHETDPRWRRVCVDGKIVLLEEGGWLEVTKEDRDVVDLVVDSS